jgi:AraC-like DNA-binding protein
MTERARLAIAPGIAAYEGPATTGTRVAHDAACAVLPHRGVTALVDEQEVEGLAWIRPRQRHTLGSTRVTLVFFDPDHRVARARPWEYEPAASLEDVRAAVDAWLGGAPFRAEAIESLARRAAPRLDARAAGAVRRVHDDPTLSLRDLSPSAGLSPSRLRHLLREETGVPFSRLALWAKLTRAVAAIARGENLARAASEAGFADHAHLTRTFVSMFGQRPSELVARLGSAHARPSAMSATRTDGRPNSAHVSSATKRSDRAP